MNIRINDFDKELSKILKEYGENVKEKTQKAAKKAATIAKQETRADAPVKTGRYQKGFAVSEEQVGPFPSSYIVHNRTRYQLTHLLEKGHAKRNGGRVRGIPHFAPADEHAQKNFEKAVEKIAQEG